MSATVAESRRLRPRSASSARVAGRARRTAAVQLGRDAFRATPPPAAFFATSLATKCSSVLLLRREINYYYMYPLFEMVYARLVWTCLLATKLLWDDIENDSNLANSLAMDPRARYIFKC